MPFIYDSVSWLESINRLEEYLMIDDDELADIERDHDHDIVHRLASEIRRMRAVVRANAGVRGRQWPRRNEIVYPSWALSVLGLIEER